MSSRQDLLDDLANFNETPETFAHDLRLDLAALIGRGLDRKQWTQDRLAIESGMPPPQVSRIINAGRNCTLESAARLLFALGIVAKLAESQTEAQGDVTIDNESGATIKFSQDSSNGDQEISVKTSYAAEASTACYG